MTEAWSKFLLSPIWSLLRQNSSVLWITSSQFPFVFVFSSLLGNVCHPNPCKNGATCVPTDSSYDCDCVLGWTGPHCESKLPSVLRKKTACIWIYSQTYTVLSLYQHIKHISCKKLFMLIYLFDRCGRCVFVSLFVLYFYFCCVNSVKNCPN